MPRHLRSVSPRRSPARLPHFQTLVRLRANEMLDAASAYPVILLIAGAGCGKSVALGHWLDTRREPVVRFKAAGGSVNPFVLADGLATAFEIEVPALSKTVAAACRAARKTADSGASLAAWFSGHVKDWRGIVAFDDLHAVAGSDPQVSRMIARLVDGTRERTRWAIASRSECGLPVASWIAYGITQLPLGETDLAFTADEVTAFATAASDATAGSLSLDALYELTQGWPAAVGFGLMSVARGLPFSAAMAATRDIAYQFLAEQVFESLSEDDRFFLLDSCVYDALDPNVLRSAGFADAIQTLERLRTQVSFIHRDETGYHYHDLFRAFLQHQLTQSDTRWSQAWFRAGRAFEATGSVEQALRAYLHVPEHYGECVRLLEQHGLAIIERGRRDAVDAALEKLPSDENPVLMALRANAAANTGDVRRSDALYGRSIELARDEVEAVSLSLRYADDLVRRSGPASIVAVLEPVAKTPVPDDLKASVLGTLAVALCRCDRAQEARTLIERALVLADRHDHNALRATIYHQAGFIAFHDANNELAASYAKAALGIARSNDLYGLTARAQSVLLNIAYDNDDAGQMLWICRQMEKVARESGDMVYLFAALVGALDSEVERGASEAIGRLDEELKSFDPAIFPRASEALAPAFALRACWQGAFAEAVGFVAGTEGEQPGSWRRALRAAELSLYAAAAGQRERSEAAFGFAQRELREPDTVEPYSAKRHARALLFLALAALLLGRSATANNLIGEARRLAPLLSKRYRDFINTVRSLYVHVETGMRPDDFEAALSALQHHGLGGIANMIGALPLPHPSSDASAIASLTKTEIRVLRSMASIASTKILAEDLGIARSTVESHIKAIRRKLGCNTRHDAIRIARERGII